MLKHGSIVYGPESINMLFANQALKKAGSAFDLEKKGVWTVTIRIV